MVAVQQAMLNDPKGRPWLTAIRHFARHADVGLCSNKELAEMYPMPLGAPAKIVQCLAKAALLHSQDGIKGSCILSQHPHTIYRLGNHSAIEGPLFITSYSSTEHDWDQSSRCRVRRAAAQGRPQYGRSFKPTNDLRLIQPEFANSELVQTG
jgi:DNA-binding IscR family transcriptional regulator